jgi:S-formylglutathione hydrolase
MMPGQWSTLEIAGHPVDVYDPPKTVTGRSIIYLHPVGLEVLRDRPAFTRVLDDLGLPCACPHGMHSWWADRLCREFDSQRTAERWLVEHVTPAVIERWNIGMGRVGLLGISMGGQGALRLGFKHPRAYPAVAAIAAAIDYHQLYGCGGTIDEMYDSKEHCRQDTAIMHIHPSDYPPHIFFCIDPTDADWYRSNDRLHEKLNALGVPHECDLATRAGGHSWAYFNAMAERAIRFLDEGLKSQARRLL